MFVLVSFDTSPCQLLGSALLFCRSTSARTSSILSLMSLLHILKAIDIMSRRVVLITDYGLLRAVYSSDEASGTESSPSPLLALPLVDAFARSPSRTLSVN